MTVVHAWEGAVTPSGFTVVAKVTGTSTRLAYSTSSDLSSPSYTDAQAPTLGIVRFTLTGLTANTRYYWGIEDDTVLDPDHRGTAKTFPTQGQPASFKFGAGACSGGKNVVYPGAGIATSNSPIFDTIRTWPDELLFFAHLGDLHYADIDDTEQTRFRNAFDHVLANDKQEALYRNTPIVYMYDDHDFGPNNAQGLIEDTPADWREPATLTYRERVPHYPLAEPTGAHPVYQSFQVGRVLFVLTDQRADSEFYDDHYGQSVEIPVVPAPTTDRDCLGPTQRAWLADLLNASTASALIWLSTRAWVSSNESAECWGQYAIERLEVLDILEQNGWTGRMCLIAGDIHSIAIDDGRYNAWGGFPCYQFAALDCSGIGGDRGGPWMTGFLAGGNKWGVMEVDDDGETITITGTAYTDFDTPWNTYSFTIGSDTTAPATPTGLTATEGDTVVGLNWNDNTEPDLDRYQYRVDGGTAVNAATSSATVTGLTNDVEYDFEVRAVDTVGNASDWSAVVSATPTSPGTPPVEPGTNTVRFGDGVSGTTWIVIDGELVAAELGGAGA